MLAPLSLTHWHTMRLASEIVLIDINKEKVEGEVMDIEQGTCFRSPVSLVAGDYRRCQRFRHRDHYFRNRP